VLPSLACPEVKYWNEFPDHLSRRILKESRFLTFLDIFSYFAFIDGEFSVGTLFKEVEFQG
jgi:hypothetical protein